MATNEANQTVKIPIWTREQTACYSETSILARKSAVCGAVVTNEALLIVSNSNLDPGVQLPVYTREAPFTGTSYGQNIQGGSMQAQDSGWQATFAEKKQMLGKRRKDVGGKTDGFDAIGTKPREPTDVEPVNFWAMGRHFCRTNMKEWQINGSVDFGADTGDRALEHVIQRKPYTGLCWTTYHAEKLMERLIEHTFLMMLEAEEPEIYDAALASLVQGAKKPAAPAAAAKKKKRETEENNDPNKVSPAAPEKTPPQKKQTKHRKLLVLQLAMWLKAKQNWSPCWQV